jgi:HEAT repeat protein
MEALEHAGDEFACAAAIERLDDDSPVVRSAAMDILRKQKCGEAVGLIHDQIGRLPPDEQVVLLTEGLAEIEMLQMHALAALAALGELKLTVALGVTAMSSPVEAVRASGALALGEIGDPGAVPSLRYGMEVDSSWMVNRESAFALLKLGRRAEVDEFAEQMAEVGTPERAAWGVSMRLQEDLGLSVQWILDEATYQLPGEVRTAAALVLGELGVLKAEGRLEEMIGQLEPTVRVAAAYALVLLGQKSYRSIIIATTRIPDADGRALAAELLMRIDYRKRFEILGELLRDPSPKVRFAAVEAFRHVSLAEAYDRLAPALGDEDDRVRLTAAALLRNGGKAEKTTSQQAPPAEED